MISSPFQEGGAVPNFPKSILGKSSPAQPLLQSISIFIKIPRNLNSLEYLVKDEWLVVFVGVVLHLNRG